VGREVATVDLREISVGYGQQVEFLAPWNTATLYAGDYLFRVRARVPAEATDRAQASQPFKILPDTSAFARVVPVPPIVTEGSAAGFDVRVESRSANVALDGLIGHLKIAPAGDGTPVFASETTLPLLLRGGVWEGRYTWPAATPSGPYAVALEVGPSSGLPLATASASLVVTPAGVVVKGTLALNPADILAGGDVDAALTVTNQGASGLAGYPLAIEVMSAGTSQVALSRTLAVDLAAGETQQRNVRFSTGGLASTSYPVFLKGGAAATSLDR